MCNCRPTTKKRKTAEKNDDDDSDGIYSNTEVQTIVQSRLVARGLRFTIFSSRNEISNFVMYKWKRQRHVHFAVMRTRTVCQIRTKQIRTL